VVIAKSHHTTKVVFHRMVARLYGPRALPIE